MQGRVGPPAPPAVLRRGQAPREGARAFVARSQNFYILGYLVFIIFAGALFFAGGDLLLVIFALTLARRASSCSAAYSASSPYASIGAERELVQMMAYEPMVILVGGRVLHRHGLVLRERHRSRSRDAADPAPARASSSGFFYVLTMKLRKSPFDISTSHHAHQEIVKGVTTEFSGSTLGMIEIAHWYETVFLLGLFWLFFAWSPVVAVDRARARLPRRDPRRQCDRARQVGLRPDERLGRDARPLGR